MKQNSPVASSQSNGLADKAIQEVEGHVRTLKIALEGRLKVSIPSETPIMMWLIEHAGDLMNRFRVGEDGRTPRERNTGKKDFPMMAEFGESVLYLPMDRDRGQTAELDDKFFHGIWLGLEKTTNELQRPTNFAELLQEKIQVEVALEEKLANEEETKGNNEHKKVDENTIRKRNLEGLQTCIDKHIGTLGIQVPEC